MSKLHIKVLEKRIVEHIDDWNENAAAFFYTFVQIELCVVISIYESIIVEGGAG